MVAPSTFAVEPAAEQLALLKAFREEFIPIAPTQNGKFAWDFDIGRDEGGQPSERPARPVRMIRRFEIARYEVPQNLWRVVMGDNPSKWKGERNSVEMVNYEKAVEFCRKATELLQAARLIDPAYEVRLPTEAEWEYCARAGTTTVYSFGDDAAKLDDYGWHTGNAAGNDPPVGAKKPNPWGLYDVHGYLWEWCADDWNDDHSALDKFVSDGGKARTGPSGKKKVLRGGSWKDKAEALTSTSRRGAHVSLADDDVGLRCVLAAKPFSATKQEEIYPGQTVIEFVWQDGEFTEGPAAAPDGAIFFSDIGNSIYRYDPKTKETKVFRTPTGRANGLAFDAEGRLLAAEGANDGGGRRISITEAPVGDAEPKVRTLTDNWQGKRFNSPNDLAVAPNGDVYFTDPRYVGDEPRDLDFEGVFVVSPDGNTRLATRDIEKPNGILVTADGETVYVADTNLDGNLHLVSFSVNMDGTLTNKQVLFDFACDRGIDGMTFDERQNIYAAVGPGEKWGIYVFGPNGENLAYISGPDATNCEFGKGEESRCLYFTGSGPVGPGAKHLYGLFRIRLDAAPRF